LGSEPADEKDARPPDAGERILERPFEEQGVHARWDEVNAVLIDTVCEEQPMQARRDDQDHLCRVLPPSLYGAPKRLQDGRAKVADGKGVAQARMDGEDQRQTIKPGGRGPNGEDSEVFAKVYVHHIGPRGNDRGEDSRLGSVELTETSDGQSQAYNAGVVTETFEIRRGRRTRGQHRLEDAAPVERPGQLGCVVLHPPYGVKPYTLAHERRRGWLED
jgi:hypothetical protein